MVGFRWWRGNCEVLWLGWVGGKMACGRDLGGIWDAVLNYMADFVGLWEGIKENPIHGGGVCIGFWGGCYRFSREDISTFSNISLIN